MNAKCWNNVGHSLEGQSKFEEALGFFRHAALVQPDDAGALINVARTYKNLNMEDEAEKWFYYAIKLIPTADNADEADVNYTRMNPNYLFAFISLANMIKEDPNRFDEADKLYQRAYRMRYDQVEAYTNRGELLLRRNRTREAREMFVKARHYDEKNPDLWYNLGVSYLLENREAEAFPIFERALILDPSHRKSKYNYAALLFDIPSETEDNRNAIKAQKIMEELWDEDEKDHKVASRLATHFLHLKQKETALLWYERAAESGTDEITLFNFALTLSEMGRFEKALVYAQNALEMKPDYVKAYALKGDILTKMRKLVEANEAFEKALEFDPEHLISGHNLCVNKFNLHMPKVPVSVLECFEKFSKIAPPNHEIHNHFKRVLSQIKRN